MTYRTRFVAAGHPHKAFASPVLPCSGKGQATAPSGRFRRISSLVLFVISSCVLSNGRTDPQASVPTFQASTELVSVPVIVKDRHGNRVYGLTKTDFRIFEDGHEVEIRNFAAAVTQTGPAISQRVPAGPRVPMQQEIGGIPIILFFDQLNTPANEQPEVRRRLALWYQSQQTLGAPTCVILYTGWALRILQQPTIDAAKIRSAIESIPTTVNSQGSGATGELPLPAGANENLPIGTGDGPLRTITRLDYFWHRATGAGDTQSALIYAGQLFAAWPDEKALIWVSAGTTVKVWTAPLQAAQVKLYPLNVHTNIPYLFTSSFTTPATTYQYETEVNGQLLQNMREAGQETGGEVCSNSFEPQSCIQKAIEDATDHYSLTYETHSRSSQTEWRQIRVRVDRPGVTVFARNGVMIAPTLRTVGKKPEQIAAALASPVDLPGLRLELAPFPPHQPGQKLLLSLLMRSDASRPGVWNTEGTDFTVAGIVLCGSDVVRHFGEDVRGTLPRKAVSDLDASGLTWTYKIAAPKNATAVRLVVRDNATGRIGSITRSLP